MKNIPLIIPVFNQLTYTRNLVNWWKFYYPENPVYIMDNGSTYAPLSEYLHFCRKYPKISGVDGVVPCFENDFIPNLRKVIRDFEVSGIIENYYVISDPDIMPHPSTPTNFLEVFKFLIELAGFHRAGFGLITDGLHDTLYNKGGIIENEKSMLNKPFHFQIGDNKLINAFRAPIDTTFCMYSKNNGGWSAPMNGRDWSNCARVFEAYHLPWFLDGDNLNPEMDNYFKSCKRHVHGEPSAGSNNSRPVKFN